MTTLPIDESRIRLAARMYETRDLVRRLSTDYNGRIAKFRPYIRGGMNSWDCNEIQAAQRIIERLQKDVPGSEMTQMCVLATAVEMIEEAGNDTD